MPYTIAITCDQDLPDLDLTVVEALVSAALAAEGVEEGAEVGIVFTDDATIHRLNRGFRGVDQPTDVLSFGLSDRAQSEEEGEFVMPPGSAHQLGEVIVSCETAARQATEHGRALSHEMAHLVVHGVLHLLGHDHTDPADEAAMRAREDEVLSACGFPSGAAGWRHAVC